MARPDTSEYADPYRAYVALAQEVEIVPAMRAQLADEFGLLKTAPAAEFARRHPPYTWSIKQVVGHLIDAERIFGCRALRFARGDATPVPGFDENPYAELGDFDRRSPADLLAESDSVRHSHLFLFENLADEAWDRRGVASGHEVSVRALAYIMVGHVRHHLAIVRKRLSLD
jgi:DinB family protein